MHRPAARLAALAFSLVPAVGAAQAPDKPAAPAAPAKTAAPAKPAAAPAKAKAKPGPVGPRFRLVLNFAFVPGSTSYDDLRTPTAYAETSQIRTSSEAKSGIGPQLALQASLYRGLGLLLGYSYTTRDTTGTLDVTRPHPLYLNRPRTASAELPGGSYTEGAIDVDLAYSRSAGSLDWALFGGVSFFKVKADLLDVPTFNEVYPYDQLTILSTPLAGVEQNATGWNLGGRLDYRFGKSKRFGAGVEVRYSNASVELEAAQASSAAKIDAGGLAIGAGLRVYF